MSERKRKLIPPDLSKQAIVKIQNGAKLRETARKYEIPKSTLSRYVKEGGIPEDFSNKYKSKHVSTQVFTTAEESILCKYLILSCRMHYGLSTNQTTKLAFEFGLANKIKMPANWHSKQCASKDWLRAFMKRNEVLSLRKPEPTSLSRATSFNRKNVSEFFDKLRDILSRQNFEAGSIWNIDETGLTTVQVPGKIVAIKGVKQIGKVTSAERGTLVTLCCGVNAMGNFLPPFFIFPRVHFKENMLINAPPGSVGTAHFLDHV